MTEIFMFEFPVALGAPHHHYNHTSRQVVNALFEHPASQIEGSDPR